MKHNRNHRKDRFVQQCSGYCGNGESEPIPEESKLKAEMESFRRLKEIPKDEYPIYIANSGGWYWHETSERHLFATRIDSPDELERLGKELFGL